MTTIQKKLGATLLTASLAFAAIGCGTQQTQKPDEPVQGVTEKTVLPQPAEPVQSVAEEVVKDNRRAPISDAEKFMVAIADNKLGSVRYYLENNLVDVNAPVDMNPLKVFHYISAGKYKPLALAVEFGSVDVVELIIEHGANVNAKDSLGYTALIAAVLGGKPAKVEVLLRNGADVRAKYADGWTALMLAENKRIRDNERSPYGISNDDENISKIIGMLKTATAAQRAFAPKAPRPS